MLLLSPKSADAMDVHWHVGKKVMRMDWAVPHSLNANCPGISIQ